MCARNTRPLRDTQIRKSTSLMAAKSKAKLFELFDMMLLGRNPNSGFKLEAKDFYLQPTGVGTFSLHINLPDTGEKAQIDFRDYTGKLNAIGMSRVLPAESAQLGRGRRAAVSNALLSIRPTDTGLGVH